jgi:hypothetical protein
MIRITDGDDPTALHRVVEVSYSAKGVRVEIGTPSLETLIGQQFPYLGPAPELLELDVGADTPELIPPGVPEVPGELAPPDWPDLPPEGAGGGSEGGDDEGGFGHKHRTHHGGRVPKGGFDHPHKRHHR